MQNSEKNFSNQNKTPFEDSAPHELIKEKLVQHETLAITEKLHLIWTNRLALVVAIIFGLVVPGLVLDFKLKAEGCQADAATFLGISVPSVAWIVITLALGLVSLNSLFSTFGLMVPRDRRSTIIRVAVCVGVEIAWLAIDPRWLAGNAADWFELLWVGFLLLLIVFSNAVCFGSWIAEWQEERTTHVWVKSHAARHQENERTILSLRRDLEKCEEAILLTRQWFISVQELVDHCPAGPSGSCVLVIERRKVAASAYCHEIGLRSSDVARTACEPRAPIVLSDPLLNCSTLIGWSPMHGGSYGSLPNALKGHAEDVSPVLGGATKLVAGELQEQSNKS